jgi:antitoxin (DNA-binding transcriptional repressor) of toxin-antitoxin stability system/predicted GIY-YIG superfamily endonuclease
MSKCTDMPTALYRLYDESGALLYIGISNDPDRRFEQHAYDKPWWPRVASRVVEWLPDRTAAEQAEIAAIRKESPQLNGTHSLLRRRAGDHVVEDGVREVSMSVVRSKLSSLLADVDAGRPVALVEHGRRVAHLVSPEFFEEAVSDQRVLNAMWRFVESRLDSGLFATASRESPVEGAEPQSAASTD